MGYEDMYAMLQEAIKNLDNQGRLSVGDATVITVAEVLLGVLDKLIEDERAEDSESMTW